MPATCRPTARPAIGYWLRVIGSPDPLDQIEIAHAALETRRQLGKSIQLIA